MDLKQYGQRRGKKMTEKMELMIEAVERRGLCMTDLHMNGVGVKDTDNGFKFWRWNEHGEKTKEFMLPEIGAREAALVAIGLYYGG